MGFLSFFSKLGSYVSKAIGFVREYVPESVLQAAEAYVRDAATLQLTNTEKRERVVKLLMTNLHVPESIARLAVELAYNIVKKELGV